MAIFMHMSKLTPESAAGMIEMGPTAREEYLRQAAESRGWNMLAFYMVDVGEFDAITIVEVPDSQANMPGFDAANALATTASGIPVSLRQYRLHRPADVQAALERLGTPLARPGG